jgi:hypothetical protein
VKISRVQNEENLYELQPMDIGSYERFLDTGLDANIE